MGALGGLFKFAIVTLLVAIVIQVFLDLGFTKKVYNHQPGVCKQVKPIVDGSEDIELLPNGLAVITSGLKYIPSPELANVVGKLFLYDFKTDSANPTAIELKIIGSGQLDVQSFNPHGISSHVDQKGVITLYIVNHGSAGHTVELFELDSGKHTVKHLKTIKNDLLYNPNDLIVTGPEQFYISNDHYFDNSILKPLEMLISQVSLCSIVYYNKGKASEAAQWLKGPNGLAVDPSKKYLYSAVSKQIMVFKINQDNSLTKIKVLDMSTHCDNLFYDTETNSLWTGCHPVGHEVFQHLMYPKSKSAPTQVLRLQFKNDHNDVSISEVYTNNGKDISAGTVAVQYKNQLLIGSVVHKALVCNIASPDTM